jgi:hypothetical protein
MRRLPLDDGTGWARLNLYAAASGYGAFPTSVAVTMNAALGGPMPCWLDWARTSAWRPGR